MVFLIFDLPIKWLKINILLQDSDAFLILYFLSFLHVSINEVCLTTILTSVYSMLLQEGLQLRNDQSLLAQKSICLTFIPQVKFIKRYLKTYFFWFEFAPFKKYRAAKFGRLLGVQIEPQNGISLSRPKIIFAM